MKIAVSRTLSCGSLVLKVMTVVIDVDDEGSDDGGCSISDFSDGRDPYVIGRLTRDPRDVPRRPTQPDPTRPNPKAPSLLLRRGQ